MALPRAWSAIGSDDRAPQASLGYERWVPPRRLQADEVGLLRAVRGWGRQRGLQLRYDWRLDRAARALLPWAVDHAGEPLPLTQLQHAAWRAGSTDAELSALAAQLPGRRAGPRLQRALAQHLRQGAPNRFALARRGDTVVVALTTHRLDLAPFPAQVPMHANLCLTGRPSRAGATAVRLVVARPDGSFLHLRPDAVAPTFVARLAVGATPGLLEVQVLLDGAFGPQVAAQAAVGVGVSPWPQLTQDMAWFAADLLPPQPPASYAPIMPSVSDLSCSRRDACGARADGRARLLSLVWALRRAHQLPEPQLDVRLMRAAQAHADDMHRASFVAHVSPTYGDAAQRLAARGLSYARVVETLSAAPSVDAAVAQWWHSPSHRAILLDTSVDAIGVGLAPSQAPNAFLAALLMVQHGPGPAVNLHTGP